MKVALVHDWLTGMRGGERCLQAFLKIYPESDIYTLVHVKGATSKDIDNRVKQVSFLQKFPAVSKYYRLLLPLYPAAVRRFDFTGYDLVISLSHAAAKNIHVPENCTHICYCFTPMRYIWDQAYSYFSFVTPLLWPIIKYLRSWDRRNSKGVYHFVAISRFVAARIRCYYKRSASIIYPPVESGWISGKEQKGRGKAFLYAGALVPYKKVDLAVEAFNRLGYELWIAGSGPQEKKLKKIAKSNIKFLGSLSDQEFAETFAKCRALIFPGTEDFGMIPIECLASGRPVIGSYSGALKESLNGLKPWSISNIDASAASGVFIEKRPGQECEALIESVRYFVEREAQFKSEVCRAQAGKFAASRFYQDWADLIFRLGLDLRRQEFRAMSGETSLGISSNA